MKTLEKLFAEEFSLPARARAAAGWVKDSMMITDAQIATELRTQAAARAPLSICPSEVARALAEDWRPLMPRVRAMAAEMSDIAVTQKGVPVDPVTARGPIRLRLRQEAALD